MDLNLTAEQREQLELISLHSGKLPAQVLIDAAHHLMDREDDFWEPLSRGIPPPGSQNFLEEDKLDARLERMLRR